MYWAVIALRQPPGSALSSQGSCCVRSTLAAMTGSTIRRGRPGIALHTPWPEPSARGPLLAEPDAQAAGFAARLAAVEPPGKDSLHQEGGADRPRRQGTQATGPLSSNEALEHAEGWARLPAQPRGAGGSAGRSWFSARLGATARQARNWNACAIGMCQVSSTEHCPLSRGAENRLGLAIIAVSLRG